MLSDRLRAILEHLLRRQTSSQRLVRRLQSVRGVTNNITVSWTPRTDTAALRSEIEAALERQAEREARAIQVDVHDGIISLTGTVRSWREKRAVLGTVAHAPGVRSVEDHLRLAPYA